MKKPLADLPPLATLIPFEAAARFENFTLAAEALGLTQAAISKQINALECDIGLKLFERRNRAVFLTEDGRQFARVVANALGDINDEAAAMRGRRATDEIVLFCQHCEAFYWLMPRLSHFHQRFPEIELRVVSSIDPIVDAKTPFDVAIQTTGRRHGAYPLAFTAADEIFPVCSPAYLDPPEAAGEIPLSQLHDHVLLSHRVVPQDWLDWEDWLGALGQPRRIDAPKRTFDSYPLVLQAAVAGQGIALGWRRTVEGMLDNGTLLRPCRESVFRPNEISVFTGQRSTQRQAGVNALLAWLREELGA